MSPYRCQAAVLAAALLLPGSCGPGGPVAVSLEQPGRAPAVEAPPALKPLAPELEHRMDDLLHTAEKFRGLRLERPVPRGTLDQAQLARLIVDNLRHELPPDRMAAYEEGLRAFGLVPRSLRLATYYPKLLTSQIAGFYDPRHKYLALIERGGKLLGPDPAQDRRSEDAVVVHELTHALQDQHFDLEKLAGGEPMEDETAAHTAVAEGDATLTMLDGLAGRELEESPELARGVQQMMDQVQVLARQASDSEMREIAEAPAWFRESLLFSYVEGLAFCLAAREKGGQRLLDAAFSSDPPGSTEQILHPEKWHTLRDDPIVIVWPDLSRQLPGWRRVSAGSMGEAGIRILLGDRLRDRARAAAAATGWGGDRFAVYATGRRRLLAWITDWDQTEDAAKFQAAAAALEPGWRTRRGGPRRIVLLRGATEGVDLAALDAALASARSRPTANRPPAPATRGARWTAASSSSSSCRWWSSA